MSKIFTILTSFFFLCLFQVNAQTIIFNENFEGASQQVVSSVSTGTNSWSLSQKLSSQGSFSDSAVVATGAITTLTTNAFSTLGKAFLTLEFDQICKIEFADAATIQVSNDNGNTWVTVAGANYLGTGLYGNLGNKFCAASYTADWFPTNDAAQPTNTWWKSEMFDISQYVSNVAQAKVRFVLTDGTSANGANGNYGWLIDNIVIKGAISEIQPPVITYSQPALVDSVFYKGPFTVSANITDASGIDTAMLIYTTNGGAPDTVGMSLIGTLYQGVIDTIPSFSFMDTIRYYIAAVDASLLHNEARNPASSTKSFVVFPPQLPPGCTSAITQFPYIDDFDANANVLTPTCGTIYPIIGWTNVSSATNGWTPKSGTTQTNNTGPTADHTTGNGVYLYTEASCVNLNIISIIESPCMDLRSIASPQLSFWYHMYGSGIGTLSIDAWHGNRWKTIWTKNGDQGNAWINATIDLNLYKGITKFRIKGHLSNGILSDMAIDDFKIWMPPVNDAGITALNLPTSPASNGSQPVKVSLKNYGAANLTTVNINTEINGVIQTPYAWSGNLPSLSTMDSILVGNFSFNTGAPTIRIWTSNPNGQSDGYTLNDTFTTSLVVCSGPLSGVYSVGTPSSDFATIDEAIDGLNYCGVNGPVIFNIAPGIYANQQIELGYINGVSSTNTVTFQSADADPNSVVLTYTPTGYVDSYVVKLDNISHCSFKNMTLKNEGASHSYAVYVTNNSSYNTFEGNIIYAGNTTDINSRAIYSDIGANNYNSYINNDISSCFYGIYINATSSGRFKGNRIEGNIIHNYHQYGIYVYYHDSCIILNNNVGNGNNSLINGIYGYSLIDGSEISGNTVDVSPSNYANGIYLAQMNPTGVTHQQCIVANNMVSIHGGTGNSNGIYFFTGNDVDVLNNSVLITGGTTNTKSFIITSGTNVNVKNNNFVNKGGGYAYYINQSVASSNYNNYYTTGTNFAYYSSAVNNLSNLQLATGQDVNSVSTDPVYFSNNDLHASGIGIFGAGQPLAAVPFDIDGETRNATHPCIGADEFMLYNGDAGITSLISPISSCPGDSATVSLEVRNFGLDTIYSVDIQWKINGVSQAAYSYTGMLYPGASQTVTLGKYLFSSGIYYQMEFNSHLTNGTADPNHLNDSLNITDFQTSFAAGSYLVGSSNGADYSSLDTLLLDLNSKGICGPVVFNFEAGTYTGRIALQNIMGSSSTNTITFQSLAQDSSLVKIQVTATGTEPSAILLNNQSYISINAITFEVSGQAAIGVEISGNGSHNTISNCVFNMAVSSASDQYGFKVTSSGADYNTFINNKVNNAYYGLYIQGNSTTDLAIGNQLLHNQLNEIRGFGVYSMYQDSMIIRANQIYSNSNSSSPKGIYMAYNDNAIQIVGNTITLNYSNLAYGLQITSCDATNTNPGIIANNMISLIGGVSTSYGLHFSSSTYQKVAYNSIRTESIVNTNRTFYVESGSNCEAYNNSFATNNGYIAYFLNPSTMAYCDFNNYYSTGTAFVYYQGGALPNLSVLRSTSGKDLHSMDVNPNYVSSTNLHLLSSPLDSAGTPLTYVTTDIDGQTRNALKPDIGADEFMVQMQDISMYMIDSPISFCGATNENAKVSVINTGSDTIRGNLVLRFSLDSAHTWISENVTSYIAPADTFDYNFSTPMNLAAQGDTLIYLTVEALLPNDVTYFNNSMSSFIFNGAIPANPVLTAPTANFGNSATITTNSSYSSYWYNSITATSPMYIGLAYTTPALFDTTDFYCATQGANGCFSLRTKATVIVNNIPAGDVGISKVFVNSGCGVDSNESVTIDIYNQGAFTVNTNLTASFKVDNNTWTSPENISTPIGSHDTIQYTFIAKANLYALNADTLFDVFAKVSLNNDPYALNDTMGLHNVNVSFTPLAPTFPTISIAYGTVPTLTANSTDTVYWYENMNDTAFMGKGASFTYPSSLYQTDTFYAEAKVTPSAKIIITEISLTAPNYIEIQNVSNNTVDATGWKVVVSNSYGNINTVNSTTNDIGVLQAGQVKYWSDDAGTGANYWGANIALAKNYESWVMIVDADGNLVDFAVWGYTASEIQSQSISVNGKMVSGSSIWLGEGIQTYSQSIINRIAYDLKDKSEWNNPAVGSYGAANPNMTNNGIISKTINCSSNRVPVIVNVGPPPAIDAAMDSIITPITRTASRLPQPINVKIKNLGTSNLTTCDVVYELDNTIISTYAWTGNLARGVASSPLTIYTDTFTAGVHTMRVWVSNPNGNSTSGLNFTDTMKLTFTACMNGVYTLGDSASDYLTFNAAISDLDIAGICAPVTFNIKPKTYDGQLIIPYIVGVDSLNQVTFQAENNDSTSVIIQYNANGSTDNYVIKFDSSYYVNFRHISARGVSSYSRVFVYENNASHNIVENSIVSSTIFTNAHATGFYDASSSKSSYNVIRNNKIESGYFGVYINSSSTDKQKGFVIENNTISGFVSNGIYGYYQDGVKIRNNTISATNSTIGTGISLSRCDGKSEIVGNIISIEPSNYAYGLRFEYLLGTSISPVIIANNAINIEGGTGTSYGVSLVNSERNYLAHNSINLSNSQSSSIVFSQSNGAYIDVINNIFASDAAYLAYINSPPAITTSDYNNYYTTGTNFAYWSTNCANLAALKTASGKEAHSMDVNPIFTANDNLHIANIDLNNAGFAMSTLVPLDMDGDLRSTSTPDIGADEFMPPMNDIGIVSIDGPLSPVGTGNTAVYVKVKNFGANSITAVNINWQANGIAQTTYNWTGTLLSGEIRDSILIGNYTFTSGITRLKIWTSAPNASSDGNPQNDTLAMSIASCNNPMSGNYTIGGSNADFLNFDDALLQLQSCGVSSDVVMNIAPGTYQSQISIGAISGAASNATITFQSSTLDSTDVTISNYSLPNANYVIHLDGADWIIFRNLTLQATNPSAGRVVVLDGGATHNQITGNRIIAVGTATNSAGIYSGADLDDFNSFSNNIIKNGYYGIYLRGISAAGNEDQNTIEHNTISDYYYYGIYVENSKNTIINHNSFSNGLNAVLSHAMSLNYVNQGFEITNNKVVSNGQTGQRAISLSNCNGTSTTPATVANNMISVLSDGNIISYGMYFNTCSYVQVVYNSIYVKSTNINSTGLFAAGGNANSLFNNVIYNNSQGIALYVQGTTTIAASDYNDIYSPLGSYAYWNASAANLAALSALSFKDLNSVSVNPDFISEMDLHLTSIDLNARATPLSYVITDKDGDIRDVNTPDIGADEFTPQQWDAALVRFNNPTSYFSAQGTAEVVQVRFKNYGTDTILQLPLSYQYGNSSPINETWTGILLPGDTASYQFNTTFAVRAGSNSLCAYTGLLLDTDHTNDTLCFVFGGLTVIMPSFTHNFDGPINLWVSEGTEWQNGMPQGAIIDSAHSAPNVWMTQLNSDYTNDEISNLLSPFINFQASVGAELSFWYNSDLIPDDGVSLQYSVNNGVWFDLGYVGDPLATNWYTNSLSGNHFWSGQTSGWVKATYDLSQFDNYNTLVQFRFHFFSNISSTADGFAIDDFSIILPPIANDAGVIAINAPTGPTVVGSTGNMIAVTVKNFGTNTLNSIPIKYSIDGTSVVTETMTISNGLAPDSTATYSFTTSFQGPISDYRLCAYTALTGDTHRYNDSACVSLGILTAPLDVAITKITPSTLFGNGSTNTGAPTFVKVQIKNLGTQAVTNFPLEYNINQAITVVDTFAGNILPGDSADFTFTQSYQSPIGMYMLCVESQLANDGNPTNDKLCNSYNGLYNAIGDADEQSFYIGQNQPNPASTAVNIPCFLYKSGQLNFELRNTLGQVVQSETIQGFSGEQYLTIDVHQLQAGVYFYTIEFDGKQITHRMIINK